MEILRAEPRCLLKQMYDMSTRTPHRLIELKTQVEFVTALWQTSETSEAGQVFTISRSVPNFGGWAQELEFDRKKEADFFFRRATKGARMLADRKKWHFPPKSVTVAGPYKLSADNEARRRSGPPGRRRPNYARAGTRRPRANVWFISSCLGEKERR